MANEAKTAEQQAADERKQREERNSKAEASLKLQTEKQQKINEEAQQQMDEAVPTPTQEENDRFAMGIHDDDATAAPKKRQATAESGGASYQTREQAAKDQPKQ